MDTVTAYRQVIQKVLSEYAQTPYAYGDIQTQAVFDPVGDHYLLVNVGWNGKRVHACLVHLDIIDDKIWIQRDGTEHGMAKGTGGCGGVQGPHRLGLPVARSPPVHRIRCILTGQGSRPIVG